MNIGIIAEDDSDVAVIRELTLALLQPHKVGFKKFIGDGCGKLRRKCGAWAEILVKQGCISLIVIHDLDEFNEIELRKSLEGAIDRAKPKARVVLLPKREVEAWLLYDAQAISSVFDSALQPKLPGDPESVIDPKRALIDLVWKVYKKRYLTTVHNSMVAKHLRIDALNRAASFAPHPLFIAKVKKILRKPKAKHRGKNRI